MSCKPSAGRVTIALVGMDGREPVCLPQALLKLDRPCVITYTQPQVLLANPPVRWIDMLVLSHAGCAESVARLLAWARRRWPGALQAVIASYEDELLELAAREQGAMVFLPPMSEDDWRGLLAGVKQLHTAMTTGMRL